MSDILYARQHETVDAICWRHYGRTASVTEALLNANPGLADLGPHLPQGQRIVLPATAPQPEQQRVTLWD